MKYSTIAKRGYGGIRPSRGMLSPFLLDRSNVYLESSTFALAYVYIVYCSSGRWQHRVFSLPLEDAKSVGFVVRRAAAVCP